MMRFLAISTGRIPVARKNPLAKIADSISEIRRVPQCRFRRSTWKQINLDIEARRNPEKSINVRTIGRFVAEDAK